MGPKRRAAPKAKAVVSPETAETLPDMSTITIRRKVPNDVIKKNHEDKELSENLNTPVLSIEKMTDLPKSVENTGSEKFDIKVFVKKTKGKSKLPKDTLEDNKILRGRTRSSSVDRKPIYTTLEKKETVGKTSRKRRVDKDVSPDTSSKITNKTTKRNRRACSVDILSSKISKSLEGTIVVTEGTQQINKKKNVPEASQRKVLITKSKKKMKKNEKEPLLITQEIKTDSPDMLQEENKLGGSEKEQIDIPELEPSIKKTGKKIKVKQGDEIEKESIFKKQKSPSEESSGNNNSDDCEMVIGNTPELSTRKTGKKLKIKQNDEIEKESIFKKQKSPSEESSGSNNSDDCEMVIGNTPEPSTRKTGKKLKIKQNVEIEKESILKNQKSPSEESSGNNNSNDLVLDNSPEPNTRKTGRKLKTKQNDEIEKESVLKKQKSPSEESSGNNNSNDLVLDNTPEPITKKMGKTRRVQIKPNLPHKESDGLDDLGDCDLQLDTPEIKPKRRVKKGKSNDEQKDVEDKPKISKRGRKIKDVYMEEPQNGRPIDNDVEQNEKTVILIDTPESEKTDIKPKVKRKIKAKK